MEVVYYIIILYYMNGLLYFNNRSLFKFLKMLSVLFVLPCLNKIMYFQLQKSFISFLRSYSLVNISDLGNNL